MSSLPSQSANKKNSPMAFRIRTFLFCSYSFGIETINTSIHVRFRSSLKNYTRFQTKMGKVFSDQKGPKPLPFPYIREYPPDPDPFHACQRPRQGLKMGEENSILIRLMIREPGGTPPPRIYRSIYNLNSRVLLFSDLLILFFLTQNQLAPFLPKQSVFYTLSVVRSPRFIPSPCFIPSPYFPVRVLYLVRILYPVRSPQSAVRSPCFILTENASKM